MIFYALTIDLKKSILTIEVATRYKILRQKLLKAVYITLVKEDIKICLHCSLWHHLLVRFLEKL